MCIWRKNCNLFADIILYIKELFFTYVCFLLCLLFAKFISDIRYAISNNLTFELYLSMSYKHLMVFFMQYKCFQLKIIKQKCLYRNNFYKAIHTHISKTFWWFPLWTQNKSTYCYFISFNMFHLLLHVNALVIGCILRTRRALYYIILYESNLFLTFKNRY